MWVYVKMCDEKCGGDLIKMDRANVMFVCIKCVKEVPPGLCSDDKSVHWVSIVCQK